jgi:hypothetical protein
MSNVGKFGKIIYTWIVFRPVWVTLESYFTPAAYVGQYYVTVK